MNQRCHDHSEMKQVVGVPKQIKFPRSPPLRHPRGVQACTNLSQWQMHQHARSLPGNSPTPCVMTQ